MSYADLDQAGFDSWWLAILLADEACIPAQARGDASTNTITSCVFCGKSLEWCIRRKQEAHGAMLAWWERGNQIVASGLYCNGRDRCLDAAEQVGHLLDTHAEYATGKHAIRELERIVFTYPRWDQAALRRLIMCCTELSHFPTQRRP